MPRGWLVSWQRSRQGDFSDAALIVFSVLTLAFVCKPLLFAALDRSLGLDHFLWSLAISPVIGAALALLLIARLRRRLLTIEDALQATSSPFVIYDRHDRLVLGNEPYREVLGIPANAFVPGAHYADLVRQSLTHFMPAEEIEAEVAKRLKVHQRADGVPTDRQYPNANWSRVVKARTERGSNVGIAIDVTEVYELRTKLEAEAQRFSALVRSAPVGICQLGVDGTVRFVNDALLGMLDVTDEATLHAEPCAFVVSGRLVEGFGALLKTLALTTTENEVRLIGRGEARTFIVRKAFVPTGELSAKLISPERIAGENIITFVDITSRKAAEAHVRYLAHHDPLTGAKNRAAFGEHLSRFAAAARPEAPIGLLSFDLDRFKPVNDLYGHLVGDELLRRVVQRVTALLPAGTAVYRVGGDEFALLYQPGARALGDLAQSIVDTLCEPFNVEGHRITIGASTGTAELPRDANTAEALVHCADLALYAAKANGGDQVVVYEPSLRSGIDERRVMELELVEALEQGDIVPVFQPVLSDDGTLKAEALARWRSRRTGDMVPPQTFIPVAENANLIARIDKLMFDHGVETMVAWRSGGCQIAALAINMSARTLESEGIAQDVRRILDRHGLDPSAIVIELTESFAIRNASVLARAIREIAAHGVRFALDDFGTGYTSLRQIADLPFSFVKIDRSFVRDLRHGNGKARQVVRAMVELARSLGIEVIAEGIESDEDLATLRRLGCRDFQGHHLGPPVSAEEFVLRMCADAPCGTEPVLRALQSLESADAPRSRQMAHAHPDPLGSTAAPRDRPINSRTRLRARRSNSNA